MKRKITLFLILAMSFSLFAQVKLLESKKTVNGIREATIFSCGSTDDVRRAYENRTIIISEGFDGSFLPSGWTQDIQNTANTWVRTNPVENNFNTIEPTSLWSAMVPWVAANQDEWLYSPIINPSGMSLVELQFYAGVSGGYLAAATLKCLISTNNGSSWNLLWNAIDHIDSNAPWSWNLVTLDLSSYSGGSFKIAWQYVGNDGDLAGIDGVEVSGEAGTVVTANFSASQTNITTDQSIQFNNTSTNSTSWNWEFEGGSPSTSIQKDPIVTYNTVGTFNVKLTAKSGTNQDIEIKNNYITVSSGGGGELEVEIAADPGTSICEFGSVNLTAMASGATGSYQYTWTWDIDGQIITGNTLNITNLATSAEVYLTVSSGGQQVNKTTIITVNDNPPASIVGKGSPERMLICPHPDLEYQWYHNNSTMPGAQKQFYYPGETSSLFGVYYVLTTNQDGCSSYSENYTISSNKTAFIDQGGILSAYPNPSNGTFSIDLNPDLVLSEIDKYSIEVYSATGVKVWATSFSSAFTFNIVPKVKLSAGIYIIKLYGDNQLFDTQKLLVN